MTILVDEAIWKWRGDRWAHLVSDVALDELHEFAAHLGRRRFSFQGDHYDIPRRDRERAIELGAEPTPGRVLARRLRAAGLRLPPAQRPPAWHIVHRGDPVPLSTIDGLSAPDRLARAMDRLGRRWDHQLVGVRAGEVGVLCAGDVDAVMGAPAAEDLGVDGLHRSAPPDDHAAIELFVRI